MLEVWLASVHVAGTAVAVGQRAEAEGFDGISFGDTQNIAADPFAGLCLAADPDRATGPDGRRHQSRDTSSRRRRFRHRHRPGRVGGPGRARSGTGRLVAGPCGPGSGVRRRHRSIRRGCAGLPALRRGGHRRLREPDPLDRRRPASPKYPSTSPQRVPACWPSARAVRNGSPSTWEHCPIAWPGPSTSHGRCATRTGRRHDARPAPPLSLGAYLVVAAHPDVRVARQLARGSVAPYAHFSGMPGSPSAGAERPGPGHCRSGDR